jgi:hypothetical protein
LQPNARWCLLRLHVAPLVTFTAPMIGTTFLFSRRSISALLRSAAL